MVNYSTSLDDVYFALSSEMRRKIIDLISSRSFSLSELAKKLHMSLPALHKHTRVLVQTKLAHKNKVGRVTYLVLEPNSLVGAEQWISEHKKFWVANLDSLEELIKNGE